jgi:hypothetical protein
MSDTTDPRHDIRVAVIMADPRALKAVRHLENDVVNPDRLSRAWAALPREDQDFWAARYGLDGGAPLSFAELAKRFPSDSPPASRLGSISHKLQRWTKFGFAGLHIETLMHFVKAGITSPEDLPERINPLVLHGGVGRTRFMRMENWLLAHGYPSLVPSLEYGVVHYVLPPDSRR